MTRNEFISMAEDPRQMDKAVMVFETMVKQQMFTDEALEAVGRKIQLVARWMTYQWLKQRKHPLAKELRSDAYVQGIEALSCFYSDEQEIDEIGKLSRHDILLFADAGMAPPRADENCLPSAVSPSHDGRDV